jgi:hypothetical protein
MIVYSVLSGAAYPWLFLAHRHTASLFSTIVSACGLIVFSLMLSSIYASTAANGEEDAFSHHEEDIMIQYLTRGNHTTQREFILWPFLLTVLAKVDSPRMREQAVAFINLFISFGLSLMLLVFLSSMTLIFFPRPPEFETMEGKRASEWYRMLSLGLLLRRYSLVSWRSLRCVYLTYYLLLNSWVSLKICFSCYSAFDKRISASRNRRQLQRLHSG